LVILSAIKDEVFARNISVCGARQVKEKEKQAGKQ
jgi:hypothetical protein